MKIIQRTNAQVTGNAWVMSVMANTSVHLDGKKLTVRIKNDPQHWLYVKLIKALYGGKIQAMDPASMNNVSVDMTDDPQAPDDLVLHVDWSAYSGSGGGFSGFLGALGLNRSSPNIGDITFHDWYSKSLTAEWIQDGLLISLAFENKADQLTYDVCGTDVTITDLVLNMVLVPYVVWEANTEPRLDRKGQVTTGYWLSGNHIYVHRCRLAFLMTASNISPANAQQGAKSAADQLEASLRESLSEEDLFRYVEALFVKDNDLSALTGAGSESRLRGLDITPNLARFLYFDEEDDASQFIGKGRIVAVRKDRIQSALLPPSEWPTPAQPNKKVVQTYTPDNIIEVEVEKPDGKRIRISSLNLVRSILTGKAQIEDVHVVIRDKVWGKVMSTPIGSNRVWMSELYYSGFLRSNPDAQPADNLDKLQRYEYNRADPLYRNLYDGVFFFVQPDLTAFMGLVRYMYHRAWHLPGSNDPTLYTGRVSETELLNGYIGSDRTIHLV